MKNNIKVNKNTLSLGNESMKKPRRRTKKIENTNHVDDNPLLSYPTMVGIELLNIYKNEQLSNNKKTSAKFFNLNSIDFRL